MPFNRYAVSSNTSTSATANTNTFPIGAISATTRQLSIYEFTASCGTTVASNDTTFTITITGSTAVITAGTAITPQPLIVGGAASVFTASSAPTVGTLLTVPLYQMTFNGRTTVRWAAIDPDSRFMWAAGGGANGSVVVANQDTAAAATVTNNVVLFAE